MLKIKRPSQTEEKNYSTNFLILVVVFLAVILFINAESYMTAFAGFNSWNTSTSQVVVANETPSVGTVNLQSAAITLTAGSTTTIGCWAQITDTNGRDDILTGHGNITIYDDTAVDHDCTANAYTCYRNLTYNTGGSMLNGICSNDSSTAVTCNFTVPMYYNAKNTTTWKCHMEVQDNTTEFAEANSTNRVVNNLIGINIGSSTMDFGTISPGAFSDNVSQEISNYGNVIIDVQLNGTTMNCDTGEDIGVGNLTYNVTGEILHASWGTNLTGSLVENQLNLYPNTSAVTTPTATTNSTYWKLFLPTSDQGSRGTCTGTIWFLAVID
jgi:hypothetical protein